MSTEPDRLRTPLTTGFALVAFAANSLLCRLALGETTIDAASFTTIRLASGAAALSAISRGRLPPPASIPMRRLDACMFPAHV